MGPTDLTGRLRVQLLHTRSSGRMDKLCTPLRQHQSTRLPRIKVVTYVFRGIGTQLGTFCKLHHQPKNRTHQHIWSFLTELRQCTTCQQGKACIGIDQRLSSIHQDRELAKHCHYCSRNLQGSHGTVKGLGLVQTGHDHK